MMKKILFFSFLLFTLMGCEDEPLSPYKDAQPNFIGNQPTDGGNNGGGGNNQAGGSMSATIGGQSWSTATLSATDMLGTLMISGADASLSYTISLTFPTSISKGTYDFDNLTCMASLTDMSVPSSPVSYTAEGVGLEIITIDTGAKKVSGNFTFQAENVNDASDVITVTNGSFNITYTTFSF